MGQLVREVNNHVKLAKRHGLIPCIRLNGTSDIRWEHMPAIRNGYAFSNIMSAFSDVQFYDYTKMINRHNLLKNYHLTFSLAEDNDYHARAMLVKGMNVAAVFKTLPKVFMAHKVIDGDVSDLRFLDRGGVVVGLAAKGKARYDTSGFVR